MQVSSKEALPERFQVKAEIRRAVQEDVPQIVQLSRKLGIDESSKDPLISPVSQFQEPSWVLKNINRETAGVFVAEVNGRIIGYALGWMGQPWGYKGKRGYFCDCFVEKKYRRHGIGLALARALLNWFKEKDVECVEADVYSENEASLEMLKKLGFKEVSKRVRLALK
jgi:ribosomal protein S18 acetylase RimI-like enzyme